MSRGGFSEELAREVRAQFPTAEGDADGGRIFLDNGVGSLVLKAAVDAEAHARVSFSQNKGGIYPESKHADEIISEGRRAVADLLNAPNSWSVIQGESASDLFFKIGHALSKEMGPEDNVVSTHYEHYSNISPYLELQRRGNLREVRLARIDKTSGTLDLQHLESLVDKHTKVVTVAASSNVLGSKTNLKEVGKVAKRAGAYFIVDAVHHVPQGPVDVQEIDCDFLVFSGYKFYGPHGSYAFVRPSVASSLTPYHVDPVAGAQSPSLFELGTRDQTKFAGVKATVDYLVWLSQKVSPDFGKMAGQLEGRTRSLRVAMNAIEDNGMELSKMILEGAGDLEGLPGLKGVQLLGNADPAEVEFRDPTFSFNIQGRDGKEVVQTLWEKYRIAARSGHFWNNVQEFYGMPSVIRVTLLHYNTRNEASRFLKAMAEISSSAS